MDEPWQRASDAEREQAVVLLRDHLLAGRLTLEEFSERVESAYRSETHQDLARTGDDLPAIDSQPMPSRRRPTRITSAFFGHVVRRGHLRIKRRTLVLGLFADVDFDLREAEIEHPATALTVLVGFGNADVYVPEGVSVDVRGITVFGRRREWGRDAAYAAGPTLHVRVLSLFGTVDVWRVPHGMRGTYSEIFRRLTELERSLPG